MFYLSLGVLHDYKTTSEINDFNRSIILFEIPTRQPTCVHLRLTLWCAVFTLQCVISLLHSCLGSALTSCVKVFFAAFLGPQVGKSLAFASRAEPQRLSACMCARELPLYSSSLFWPVFTRAQRSHTASTRSSVCLRESAGVLSACVRSAK